MTLTANREMNFYTSQELVELPVADNVRIYRGAFVGLNAANGYARPLVAGDDFLGVAYAEADNTGPGHTAGGIRVKLHQHIDAVLSLPGVALTNTGATVYASDDGAATLTASGNSPIGRVVTVESSGVARVRLRPVASA